MDSAYRFVAASVLRQLKRHVVDTDNGLMFSAIAWQDERFASTGNDCNHNWFGNLLSSSKPNCCASCSQTAERMSIIDHCQLFQNIHLHGVAFASWRTAFYANSVSVVFSLHGEYRLPFTWHADRDAVIVILAWFWWRDEVEVLHPNIWELFLISATTHGHSPLQHAVFELGDYALVYGQRFMRLF
jgi:hypothetical protein